MAADRNLALGDLRAVFRRRLTLILGITAILMVAGGAMILRLPNVYVAHSVIYLDPGRAIPSFARAGREVPRLSELIATLQQEVLSRDTARQLIDQIGLYEVKVPPDLAAAAEVSASQRPPGTPDPVVDQLVYAPLIERARNDISIKLVKVYGAEFVDVAVQARAPDLAARAVNRVVELLAAKNRDLRIERADDVHRFTQGQLDSAWRHLQEEQAALEQFRAANRDTLPDREAAVERRLDELKARTYARKREIEDANAKRAALEFRINALYLTPGPGGAPAAVAASPDRHALEAELSRLEIESAQLAAIYKSPSFPDRLKADAAIAIIRRQIASLDSGAPVAGTQPDGKAGNGSATAPLPASVHGTAPAEGGVAVAGRMAGPERIIADLVRRRAAQTAQIRTIELAEAPLLPSSPNRPLLAGALLVFGLGLGGGISYLLELRTRTYYDACQVEADLGTDVLAVLPAIPNPETVTAGEVFVVVDDGDEGGVEAEETRR